MRVQDDLDCATKRGHLGRNLSSGIGVPVVKGAEVGDDAETGTTEALLTMA